MKTHTLKYKLPDGTWVAIPIFTMGIYDAYKEYCILNNIRPVDQNTYYRTLGELETIVADLTGNAANINELNKALAAGALPLSKGGLGSPIGVGNTYKTLQDLLVAEAGVALHKEVVENTNQISELTQTVSDKMNSSVIAYGDKKPAEADIPADALFYFQYEE